MTSNFHLKNYYLFCFFIAALLINASCKTTQSSLPSPSKPGADKPAPSKEEPAKDIKEVKKDEPVKMRVALIMPFELEQNFAQTSDELSVPEVNPSSLIALNFYEGALIAADSLKSASKEIQVVAYDTPSDSAGIVRMLTNPAIKEASIVIGTFPNNLTNAAIEASKKANINLILTQAGTPSILEKSKNIAIAYASTITQCREMASYMMEQNSDANVILVYRTLKREEELAAVFRQEIQKLKKDQEFKELNATTKSYKDVVGLLSKTKRNIVFLVSSDEAFVNPVVSLLEEQNLFGILVTGLPTWQTFESIDFMSLKNVQVYLFDNNFIDTEDSEHLDFRKKFISRFSNDPMTSGYDGFEITYNLGKSFEKKDQDFIKWIDKSFSKTKSNFLFNEFSGGGMENKSISVLRFNDYKLEKVNVR